MMGEFGNRGGKVEGWGVANSFIFLPVPVQASQTSLGESVFLVNKPQAHNGASNSRERKKLVR